MMQKTHPLKLLTLISIAALIINQLSLIVTSEEEYRWWISAVLVLPLLFPLKGLWTDRRYTYKWTGFLPMLYFFIGVSEDFVASGSSFYGSVNILASGVLFIASMYYSRYLRHIQSTR